VDARVLLGAGHGYREIGAVVGTWIVLVSGLDTSTGPPTAWSWPTRKSTR